MISILPIVFCWLLFLVSLTHLLVQLVLIHFLNEKFFLIASMVLFVCMIGSFFHTFRRMGKKIMDGVQTWDDDMKKDIVQFISARKVRLISSGLFITTVFVIHIYLRMKVLDQRWLYIREGIFYLYLISLFHLSLISTLIYLKLIRTLTWVHMENKMAELETE